LFVQEVDEDDQALLDAYVPQGQLQPGRTLADLIMEKIGQAEDGGKGKEPGNLKILNRASKFES
jgi:essential nuclear protein 1